MLKNIKKQMLLATAALSIFGLAGCANKVVPQSSETTVVSETKDGNQSKSLEKAIDESLFRTLRVN